MNEIVKFENIFFQFIDEVKDIIGGHKWKSITLDCSKNELLALFFIYRKEMVNNSDIAEYIGAPLNTVTGVINRLEKKGLVERIRDSKDKRVVNITLTDTGKALVNEQKEEILFYFKKIYEALDDTERSTLINIVGKILPILKGADIKEKSTSGKRIRKIEIE